MNKTIISFVGLTTTIFLFIIIGYNHPEITARRSVYLQSVDPDYSVKPVLSVGQTAYNGYAMVGAGDGTGVIDNHDETFTLFINHELDAFRGSPRYHGQTGAFISQWRITKPGHALGDWTVLTGQDAIKRVYHWNPDSNQFYLADKPYLARFCSADLADDDAYFDNSNYIGTQYRILLTGEENDKEKSGTYGRAYALIADGPNQGTLYELPKFGRMSFENLLAAPYTQEQTIVIATDDAAANSLDTLGEIYVYVGTKQKTGRIIERAGLTNGDLYAIAVENLPVEDVIFGLGEHTSERRFHLEPITEIEHDDGSHLFELTKAFNTQGITKFFRPEDGAWNTADKGTFYFTTTGVKRLSYGSQTVSVPGRIWSIHFDDYSNPLKGGVIKLVLGADTPLTNPDNLTYGSDDLLYVQEDPGSSKEVARIWQINPQTGAVKIIAQHNPLLFNSNQSAFITHDEETSGIIDLKTSLNLNYLLGVSQIHIPLDGWADYSTRFKFGYNWFNGREFVEEGQLFVIARPESSAVNAP